MKRKAFAFLSSEVGGSARGEGDKSAAMAMMMVITTQKKRAK